MKLSLPCTQNIFLGLPVEELINGGSPKYNVSKKQKTEPHEAKVGLNIITTYWFTLFEFWDLENKLIDI